MMISCIQEDAPYKYVCVISRLSYKNVSIYITRSFARDFHIGFDPNYEVIKKLDSFLDSRRSAKLNEKTKTSSSSTSLFYDAKSRGCREQRVLPLLAPSRARNNAPLS